MRKALIVAHGLHDVVGHQQGYTQAVSDALKRRGYRVFVLGREDASDAVKKMEGFVPAFRASWNPCRFLLPLNYRLRARAFAADLERALRELEAEPDDLLFDHTVQHPHFAGWERLIRTSRLKPARPLLLLRYSLRTPGRSLPGRIMLRSLYRRMFRRLSRLPSPPAILVDSEGLREEYGEFTDFPIRVVPIPLDPALFAKQDGESGVPGKIRLLYVGGMRRGRGFELLPALAEGLAQDASLTVHCGSDAVPRGLSKAFQRLERAASGDRVRLVRKHLSQEAYLSLLRESDALVLPYRLGEYHSQTSHVFAEALALGKPAVVPDDTWMSELARRRKCGVVFSSGDGGSLVRAVEELTGNFDAFRMAAGEGRDEWIGRNNADQLAAELEKSAQGPTPPPAWG